MAGNSLRFMVTQEERLHSERTDIIRTSDIQKSCDVRLLRGGWRTRVGSSGAF